MNSIQALYVVLFGAAIVALVIGVSWVERRMEGMRLEAQAERERIRQEGRQMVTVMGRQTLMPKRPHIPQPTPETRSGLNVNPPPSHEKPPAPSAPPTPYYVTQLAIIGWRNNAHTPDVLRVIGPADMVHPSDVPGTNLHDHSHYFKANRNDY